MLFFFRHKTAYEMRISDWSSDVCSSDLSGDVKPPVVTQILGYKNLLQQHNEQLLNSYNTVINNLRALEGTGIQQRCATLPQIKPAELKISDEVRLVIFGYDSDQANGAVWEPNLDKLNEITVLRRAIGRASGRERGGQYV